MKWKNLNSIVIFNLFFLALPYGNCQTNLQTSINKILNQSDCRYANISLCAYDIESETKIIDHRAKKSLVPASSLKLVSSLTALDLFGEDFTFETKITHDGNVLDDGTLKGNLYIEGSGDPTLGFDRIKGTMKLRDLMKYIAKEVSNFGINCIDGKLIADESIFDSYPISPSWQWDDLGNYYASGAWGLNVHENTYYIYFSNRNTVGSRPTIRSHEPNIPDIEFSNEVVVDSAHTGDNAYIFGGPYDYLKRISGTIPAGEKTFRIKGAIPNPPLFFVQQLRKSLGKENIDTKDIGTQFRPSSLKKTRKHIASVFSPKLGQIVQYTNDHSLNLHAEALFKMIALKIHKAASGGRATEYLKTRMRNKKIDVRGFHMEDGSGLSSRTNVSAEVLSGFMMHQAKDHTPEYLSKYIPRVGAEGTVRNLYLHSSLHGKVWLKSGSMNRVLSYTGLMKNKDGKWISVSIIFNGFHVKHDEMRKVVANVLREIYKAD